MLIHNCSNVVDFNFHLVLVTKYRKPIFSNASYQQGIRTILQSIADNNDIIIQTMEVRPVHVHLLISFPPKMAPSSAVKLLKGLQDENSLNNSQKLKSCYGKNIYGQVLFS